MGRTKEAPRYNVISMRIDDVDAEIIDTLCGRTGQTRSDVMREALAMWLVAQQRGAARARS